MARKKRLTALEKRRIEHEAWLAGIKQAQEEREKNEVKDRNDPRRYLDIPKRQPPTKEYPSYTQECPECDGHGHYNITVHAYGQGKHFQGMCGACWSWGYIAPGTCAHSWDGPSRNIGRCLHEWSCSKCGTTRIVDSSD